MDRGKSKIKELYDHSVNEYYESFDTSAGDYYIRKKMDTFISYFHSEEPSNIRLLEIGSADGIFTEQFSKIGYKTFSIDISFTQINKAKEICGDECNFVTADGEALPFAAESFDIIVSMCTVRYFTDPSETIAQWYHLLTPNGILIIDVPNKFCPFFWGINNIINKIIKVPKPARTLKYSSYEIKEIFEKAGFEDPVTRQILLVYRYFPKWIFLIVKFIERILEHLPGGSHLFALIVCKGVKK